MRGPAFVPKTIRGFIGLPLPDALALEVTALLRRAPLAATEGFVLEQAAALHVTLKFLGSIDLSLPPLLAPALDQLAARTSPPRIVLARAWGFPHPARASVVTLELADPSGTLGELARATEEIAAAHDIPRETRPYLPHITVARPAARRQPRDASALCAALQPLPGPDDAPALVLYGSRPSTEAPAEGYPRLHQARWR